MTARTPLLVGMGLALLFGTKSAEANEQRFSAMRADGSRVTGTDVGGWHATNSEPQLSSQKVFDPNNPFRWLIDHTLSLSAEPEAYVEFVGGDRLPGNVVGYRAGTESPYERLEAHLVVLSAAELHWPEHGDDLLVRVGTQWLQRVVWERRTGAYRPGTAFLRDGRRIGFRSLRWTEEGVLLLLDDGIQNVPLSDLAEVHLPRRDPWDAYYEQLAVLAPDCTARLMRLATTDGLRATTSAERFQPQHHGNAGQPESWLHLIQPAWSLDPVWVRHRTVRSRSFFEPHQVPLTAIAPAGVRQESTFGSGWRWQTDRSVGGQPLRSGGQEYGWGLGVHAFNELTFDLPPIARTFRTGLGLDQSVGDGGCARATIDIAVGGRRTLFQSEQLIGSENVIETGPLALDLSPDRKAQLVLTVDPAHQGRPAGADPFDIRDSLDWLQPELELDPEALKQEVARRSLKRIAGLTDWTAAAGDADAASLVNHWDTSMPRDARYRLLLATDEKFVTFSQRLRIDEGQKWLALAVSRPKTGDIGPTRLQVRIDGRAAGEFETPLRESVADPEPILIPVGQHQGKTVAVEVVQIPDGKNAAVEWRSIAAVERRPGLLRVFEDEPQFAAALSEGEGEATIEADGAHSGSAALKVTPPDRAAAVLPGLDAPVREHPQLGEYRFIRYAWRKEGGSQIALAIGHDGQFGGDEIRRKPRLVRGDRLGPIPPGQLRHWRRRGIVPDNRGLQFHYRYHAGGGDSIESSALRLDRKLPSEWVVVTRDLYTDFGHFTLTGFSFECFEGDAAWFDHIYLARTMQDFERIPELLAAEADPAEPNPNADPNVVRQTTDRAELGLLLGQVAPQFFVRGVGGQGVGLLKEHADKKDVVRTQPVNANEPCRLTLALNLPEDKPARLEATAGREENGKWIFEVQANGEQVHRTEIDQATAETGWADLSVDLSQFAGQKVLLEIQHHHGRSGSDVAYWKRLEVVHD